MKHPDLNALQGINNDDAGATQAAPNGNGGAQATPVLAQPAAAAPQARSRGTGCVPGVIKTLFVLTVATVLTAAVLGLMGYRIPLIHEIAKWIGWTIVTALNSSTARLGYAAIVVPAILMIATWITAKAKR